jgi:hypothetical protein
VKWTRHKLGEANFFLQQDKSVLDQPEILSYYLSAFISAARSVTMVLQFENGENQEFIDWYSKRQKDMKNDDIFSFFNSLRIDTIHLEGKIRFRRKVSLFIGAQRDREIEMYFSNDSRDGIRLCTAYFGKLSRLVDTAEKWSNENMC